MFVYPPLTLTFLNGFLMVVPLLSLRFGLPAMVRRESLSALDHFPPMVGREQLALKVYFMTNTFLIFSPLFARIVAGTSWTIAGWSCYLIGVLIIGLALFNFSAAPQGKLIQTGWYRFSRHPIYVDYFLIFVGTALLIGSWFHLNAPRVVCTTCVSSSKRCGPTNI